MEDSTEKYSACACVCFKGCEASSSPNLPAFGGFKHYIKPNSALERIFI